MRLEPDTPFDHFGHRKPAPNMDIANGCVQDEPENPAMIDQRAAFLRWRRGHEAAARRERELLAKAGARPEAAVGESRAALNALDRMSKWPTCRDPVAAHAIAIVRRRWARVQRRARHARQG
jgi:hypothetical protein